MSLFYLYVWNNKNISLLIIKRVYYICKNKTVLLNLCLKISYSNFEDIYILLKRVFESRDHSKTSPRWNVYCSRVDKSYINVKEGLLGVNEGFNLHSVIMVFCLKRVFWFTKKPASIFLLSCKRCIHYWWVSIVIPHFTFATRIQLLPDNIIKF